MRLDTVEGEFGQQSLLELTKDGLWITLIVTIVATISFHCADLPAKHDNTHHTNR